MSQVARDSRDASGLGLSSTPEGGSGCKANKLARLLLSVQIRHATKQRRNGMGKLTDSQLEQFDQLIEDLKKKLKNMKKQKTCDGGPEVEVKMLVKMLDIMRDMEKVEKIKNRMRAKVAALRKGSANGGNDYGMMEAVLPIIQAGLPIVMKMLTAAG